MARVFGEYISDDGVGYYVRISPEMAAAANMTTTYPNLPAGGIPWPYNEFDMRHVCAFHAASNKRVRIPIRANDDPAYVGSVASLDYKGDSYVITSRIGEKRIASHIGG